jgi:hypothetical protein
VLKTKLFVGAFLCCEKVSIFLLESSITASLSLVTDHTDLVLHTLQDLGLRVNIDKSVLSPSQSIDYLGYTIDSRSEFPVIKAQRDRVKRIKRQIRSVLKEGKASARVIAKTAGLCVSVAWAVSPGKLFLRNLSRLLASRSSWEDVLVLDRYCVEELEWWLNAIDDWNFREIKLESSCIDHQLETDASQQGWGATVKDLQLFAKGDWNHRVSCMPSNYRELLAILLALLAFKEILRGKHVQILSDNMKCKQITHQC